MSIFSFWFTSRFRNPAKTRSIRRSQNRPSSRLFLEPLEERALLSTVSISGSVFHDANNNGVFDPGEAAIANSTIQLANASNVVIGTATTDANGFYSFAVDGSINTNPTTLTRTAAISAQATDWSHPL